MSRSFRVVLARRRHFQPRPGKRFESSICMPTFPRFEENTPAPALPLSQWTPVLNDCPDNNGGFTITVTNALNPTIPNCFYILETP
jgi:hypothetical protein